MTPEQALQVLDDAAALARITRQEHVLAIRAAGVLRENIERERDGKLPPTDEIGGELAAKPDEDDEEK